MMELENVRIIIGEPNYQIRPMVYAALSGAGYSVLNAPDSIDSIHSQVVDKNVDVVLCDANFKSGDFFEESRAIRHLYRDGNPFVIIIALMSPSSEYTLKAVSDAGVDDVLVRPFSGSILLNRLKILIETRKPWVVTSDYIGPDRRREKREGMQEIPKFTVPNSASYRANSSHNHEKLMASILACQAQLNMQKIRQHCIQLRWLVDHCVDVSPEVAVNHLRRFLHVAHDLSERISSTPMASSAKDVLQIAKIAARMLKQPHEAQEELLSKIAILLEGTPDKWIPPPI